MKSLFCEKYKKNSNEWKRITWLNQRSTNLFVNNVAQENFDLFLSQVQSRPLKAVKVDGRCILQTPILSIWTVMSSLTPMDFSFRPKWSLDFTIIFQNEKGAKSISPDIQSTACLFFGFDKFSTFSELLRISREPNWNENNCWERFFGKEFPFQVARIQRNQRILSEESFSRPAGNWIWG